jgi:hypothetical protein
MSAGMAKASNAHFALTPAFALDWHTNERKCLQVLVVVGTIALDRPRKGDGEYFRSLVYVTRSVRVSLSIQKSIA